MTMTNRWILFAAFFTAVFAFAGEAVNKPKNINQTGCECTVAACCVCVNETHSKALKVTLKGAGGDTFTKVKVVLTSCDNKDLNPTPANQDGPRFDGPTGPSFKEVECAKDPGKSYQFDINGGPKEGEYKVFIYFEKADGSKGCEECGKICVFPSPVLGGYKNIARDLAFPAEPQPAPPLPNLPKRGALCGVGGGLRIKPGGVIPGTPWSTLQREVPPSSGNWVDIGLAWEGAPGNLPGGGPGHKLGEVTDDCGNKIVLYCAPGLFKLYYVDCNNVYRHIGSCLFLQARNKFEVNYIEACGKKKFGVVKMTNSDASGTGKENIYIFDTCSLKLDAGQFGPGAGGAQVRTGNAGSFPPTGTPPPLAPPVP
jgi:hypothetical protein